MELLSASSTAVAILIIFSSLVWRFARAVLWRPYAITKRFREQGITGPPYSLLYGSLPLINSLKHQATNVVLDTTSNDILSRVLPHYHTWSSQYGKMFLYWHGLQPHLCVTDPEMVKQILTDKSGCFEKPPVIPSFEIFGGKGLIFITGRDWMKQRKILNPGFTIDKLKSMVTKMARCGTCMLEEWGKQQSSNSGEGPTVKVEMFTELQKVTGDIIAQTAFGSSYVQGLQVFETQKEMLRLCATFSTNFFIPGTQYIPTTSNRHLWRLDSTLKSSLRDMIQSKVDSGKNEDDLLDLMMAASHATDYKTKEGLKLELSMEEIFGNCKTFFSAGHESTSTWLTWTMFLLSIHHDWQDKLRQEVFEECGEGIPSPDMLANLKLVNLVLMESLRLYCPLVKMTRETTKDVKLGTLTIPKGTVLTIPITMIHRSEELWGEDANQFKPMRFENGMAKAATHPNALLAFSIGHRNCIGQHFAMLEAKMLLVLILRAFSFSLSSEYKHTPVDFLSMQPQYGLPIVLQPLN